MKYCYNCQSHQNFIDVRKNGVKTKMHCSTCGVYAWFNEQKLKNRQQKKQKQEAFTVAGTIELPVSFDLKATNTTQAFAQAESLLDDLGIKEVSLTVTTMDDKQIELNVHDHFIQIEQVFRGEES